MQRALIVTVALPLTITDKETISEITEPPYGGTTRGAVRRDASPEWMRFPWTTQKLDCVYRAAPKLSHGFNACDLYRRRYNYDTSKLQSHFRLVSSLQLSNCKNAKRTAGNGRDIRADTSDISRLSATLLKLFALSAILCLII